MSLTDPAQIVPLALSVNTVVVMWLAGSKRLLGWVLALVGQVGWLAFVVLFDAWGLLPLVVALTFVYGRNLRRWWVEQRERCTTCGARMSDPACSTSPDGWSGHTWGGGVEANPGAVPGVH